MRIQDKSAPAKLVCKLCNKQFQSGPGLAYHLRNTICQPVWITVHNTVTITLIISHVIVREDCR